jgi:hypothetical protein
VTEYIQTAIESACDAAETLARSLVHDVGLELANDALVEWVDQFDVDVRTVETRNWSSGSVA